MYGATTEPRRRIALVPGSLHGTSLLTIAADGAPEATKAVTDFLGRGRAEVNVDLGHLVTSWTRPGLANVQGHQRPGWWDAATHAARDGGPARFTGMDNVTAPGRPRPHRSAPDPAGAGRSPAPPEDSSDFVGLFLGANLTADVGDGIKDNAHLVAAVSGTATSSGCIRSAA